MGLVALPGRAADFSDTLGCSSYDFFYKNGVPVWRGTVYYYSRFRPGLGVRDRIFLQRIKFGC